MSKKDGLEIFELFRSGKPATAEPPPPPPPKERVTAVRPALAPTPAPAPASSSATPSRRSAGDTIITLKLNTALVGLMVGTACLFGCFALGVQYERRHKAAAEPQETAKAGETAPPTTLPIVPREIRRDTPPAEPAPVAGTTETRQAPSTEPKKGYTLQLMGYTPDQESLAQRMATKVRGQKGGEDAVVIRDKSGNFIVVAGFVEKQSGADADKVVERYRGIASRLGSTFNLDWIPATK